MGQESRRDQQEELLVWQPWLMPGTHDHACLPVVELGQHLLFQHQLPLDCVDGRDKRALQAGG